MSERSGVSRDLISDLRPLLEQAEVIVVHERSHAGQQLEHEWVLVEPSPNRTPVAGSHDPRGSQPHQSLDKEEGPTAHVVERASAEDFPADLPEDLHNVAIAAGKVLVKTAQARGQKKAVTRAAVGHAVLTFPDRDHLRVARDVEAWLMHGRGASRPCADVVARFRSFLSTADPMPGPPLPPGAAGPRGGVRRMNDREQLIVDLIEEGRT